MPTDLTQALAARSGGTLRARDALEASLDAADSPAGARRAVQAADRLAALAPASPHLVHMPSHIHVRVGRYGDAVAVNTAAVEAQARLDDRVKAAGFTQSKNWNGHNLRFLWFAAVMQGQGDLALSTARRVAERGAKAKGDWGAYLRGTPVYTLARFERWSEVLAETADPAAAERFPGFYEHARGLALVHSGRVAEANALLVSLADKLTAERAEVAKDSERGRFQLDILGVLQGELKAEMALRRGESELAIAAQREAVASEKGFNEGEPPGLAAGSGLALGRVLLRAGRAPDAEAAYRAELVAQPDSGWALRGLHRALLAQGRQAEAEKVRDAWQRSWREADGSLKAG